ncbi:MAG: DNA polymerase III subunit gamma/tau [Ignavibacteria bacterium]|nr:DNA polymerase III subunit gamma/tau [Ignavibacteria bacterium]
MSFVVTARKYRPQRFDEVVGQEHITRTLKNAIQSGRIAHAYLLTGPRGVGKTTTARILAKSINCSNSVDAEPCNQCEMCLSIQNSQLIDIIEIDAASNRGIDEIRSLRESVRYAPSKGKYKVYIIDEVHMLTKDSFNAFLKTLEEPPPHVVFIFATTDVHRVPLTILSRCQRYDFRRIQLDTIKEQLLYIARHEDIEIDDKTLTLIAKKADGGLRDAESFFDQVVAFCGKKIEYATVTQLLNVIDDELFFSISDAIPQKNFQAAFVISEKLYQNGWNYSDFIEKLTEHFRNILVSLVTKSTDMIETAQIYREKYLSYVRVFSESDILRIMQYLGTVSRELKYSQNHKLRVEIALSHIIGLERSASIAELMQMAKAGDFSALHSQQQNAPKQAAELKIQSQVEQPKPVSLAIPAEPKRNETAVHAPVRQRKAGDTLQGTPVSDENIANKWNEFREMLASEKRIQFGAFEPFFVFGGIIRSTIIVSVGDKHAKTSFEQLRKDFIEPKAAAFFGKKYTFEFRDGAAPAIVQEQEGGTAQQTQRRSLPSDDPYIDAIKKELGGEQYN